MTAEVLLDHAVQIQNLVSVIRRLADSIMAAVLGPKGSYFFRCKAKRFPTIGSVHGQCSTI